MKAYTLIIKPCFLVAEHLLFIIVHTILLIIQMRGGEKHQKHKTGERGRIKSHNVLNYNIINSSWQ